MLHRLSVLMITSLLVISCGFHLRGSEEMPMHLKTLAVLPDNPYTPIQREIRRSLKFSGVEVVPSPAGVYALHLDKDELLRSVLIIGTDGQTKQEQLIYQLAYHITPPGQDAMPQQIIQVQRILNVDYNRTLGQSLEEDTLLSEMRAEATAQLIRRLSVLKP
jgi:LPS-assembly lipoprotein